MMRNRLEFFRQISFVFPAMLLLLLLTAYPLYHVIQMSLYDYSNKAEPVFAGFRNFSALLGDLRFVKAMVHTLIYTFSSVFLDIVIGISLALLLNSQAISPKIRGVFRSVLMFPWLFSSSVVAATWALMLNPFGIINGMFSAVGLTEMSQIAWLSDERFALASLVVSNTWRGFPFVMLMMLAGLQTVPNDLKEAANVDGAGPIRTFFYIILPQLKSVILTVGILEIIWNFRSFDLVFLMTGGGPMNTTETLSVYVYERAFRSLDFGYASAMAILMLIIMILTSVVYLKNAIKED
jgi:multiple sugar transport system permease protein